MPNKTNKNKKTLGYVPPDAALNFSNLPAVPPETRYEEGRVTFDIDAVKNLVKGNYGKDEKSEEI